MRIQSNYTLSGVIKKENQTELKLLKKALLNKMAKRLQEETEELP
jgi:hypothetical protein